MAVAALSRPASSGILTYALILAAGAAIAFVSAPPRTHGERVLRITEARAVTTTLDRLTPAVLESLAGAESLAPGERATLRTALPQVVARYRLDPAALDPLPGGDQTAAVRYP